MDHHSDDATPQPEGPPKRPTRKAETSHVWEDSDSIPSLPPVPSPLDYTSLTSPLGGVLLLQEQNDSSTVLSDDKSLEERLHRSLNQNVRVHSPFITDSLPTLEVARLVQQVELLRATNAELRHENKLLVEVGRSLERQRDEVAEARMTAELREGEALQECRSLKQDLQQLQQGRASDREIKELRAEVASLRAEKVEKAAQVKRATDEAGREVSTLESQNASLEQERNLLAKELEKTMLSLSKAVTDNKARTTARAEIGVQTEPVSNESNSSKTEPFQATDCGTQTDSQVDESQLKIDTAFVAETMNRIFNSNDDIQSNASSAAPIGERLHRIRDGLERASLLKEHHREISQLKAEHESATRTLQQEFEKEKDRLLEEAMSEMNAGYKGLRRRLESECGKKMDAMEQRHIKEINRIRKEADKEAATTAESVEVALSQVVSANHRCETETKRREALERRVQDLQREFGMQTKSLKDKHASEMKKLGVEWEQERRNLLDVLQRECNLVFDRNKSNISPRSVSTEFFAEFPSVEKHHAFYPPQDGDQSTSETVSPMFSELDRTLRETEALVDMVVNGNYYE